MSSLGSSMESLNGIQKLNVKLEAEVYRKIEGKIKLLTKGLKHHCFPLNDGDPNSTSQNPSSISFAKPSLHPQFKNALITSDSPSLFKQFNHLLYTTSLDSSNNGSSFHCFGHGTCEPSNLPFLINKLSHKANNSTTKFLRLLDRIKPHRNLNGDHCVCLIHYSGENCEVVNYSYFDAWKWLYLSLAIIVTIQLVTNIVRSIFWKKRNPSKIEENDNKTSSLSKTSSKLGSKGNSTKNSNQNSNQNSYQNSYQNSNRNSKQNSNLSLNNNSAQQSLLGVIDETRRKKRNSGNNKKPVKNSFYQLLTRVSAQKVLYSLVILACMFRAFDFHSMKKNLSNPEKIKSITLANYESNLSLLDLNTVSLDFRHAQPHFLVSLFYIFIIIKLVLVICYWSECFFVPDFSQSIERKPCQGVFLYKSSIAFVCFTSILGFSTIGQFLVSSAAKLIKQDEKLSSAINIIFLLCIAVLMFAVHVAFLTIGVEIYFKLNGAFCFKQHKENAKSQTGSNSDATAIATAKLLQPFRKQHSKSIESPSIDPQRTNFSVTVERRDTANSNSNNNNTTCLQTSKPKNSHSSWNSQHKNQNNNKNTTKTVNSENKPAGPGFLACAASGTLLVAEQKPIISSITTTTSKNNRITTQFSSNTSENQQNFKNSTNSIQSSCTTESAACFMPNFTHFNTNLTNFNANLTNFNANFNANNNNNTNLENENSFFPAIGTKKSETICARIGLVLQGLLTLFLSLFIASDIMRAQWIDTIDTTSKSTYLVFFRITEFAVLVWFPACLWHPTAPESLWILNPRTLLKGSRAALDLAKKHSDKTAFYLSNFKSGLVSSNEINVNRFKASSNKSSEDCCSGNMPRSSNYTSSGSLSESATSTTIQRVKFSKIRQIFRSDHRLNEEAQLDENGNELTLETTKIKEQTKVNHTDSDDSSEDGLCYICCDPDNKDTIIRPCSCTTAVHHECLKKFILSELTTKPDHQNITYSPDRFLEQAVNNHGNGGRHSSTESDSRSRGAAQSSRNRKNNGNASDKVLRCKVCQSPYKISTQGINFSRALKKCDFVLVILTLIAAGLMPYLAWYLYNFMAKNEWQKIWQVIDVSLVIIFEYGCLKLLGFNLVKVYIAAQQGAMRIMDQDYSGESLL